MIKNKSKILFGLITGLLFATNVSASCVVGSDTGWGKISTGYGDMTTQPQFCKTAKGAQVRIYCIDKGYSNAGNLTNECTFTEVTGSGYSAIAGDFNPAFSAEKELTYRYYSYKTGMAQRALGGGTSIQNGSVVPDSIKHRVNSLSSKVKNNSQLFTETHTVSGNIATVTITINYSGLNAGNISVTNGANIVSVTPNGNQTIVVVTKKIETCVGANFKLNIKNSTSVTTSGSINRVFIARCGKGTQNYVVEIPQNIPINDVIGDGAGDSFDIDIPDPECKECTGTTNLAAFCGENGYIKDNEDVKNCIITGRYKHYCGKDIAKTQDTNTSASRTAISSRNSKSTNVSLSNNKYCSVYCTEEINYDFPGVINAKAGQYFKLRKNGGDIDNNGANMGKPLSITGKRTCYTSEIKTTQYINDVIQAQRKIINAYNNYQREKARERSIANARSETVNCTAGSCSRGKLGSTTGATGTKYIGSLEQYKSCSPNFNANGDFTGCSWSYPTVKEEWGDSFSSSGGGACAKSWDNWVQTCDKTTIPKPEVKPDADAITSALKEMYSVIETYKSCFEWKNNYCFNPIVEFSYDEPYEMKGQLEKTVHSIGEEKASYFTSIDNQYHGASTGYNLQTHNYVFADISDVSTQTSQIDLTSKYVSKEVEGRTEFKDSTKEVYTYHPYGTIFVGDNTCGNNKGNCIKLGSDGYVLPVALEHSASMYNYYLDITNIGVEGNDASCNKNTVMPDSRLMGSNCSLDEQERVNAPKTHEYICTYTVEDCPECEVKCECPANDPNCYEENNVCKYVVCPECIVTCVGCLWNNGDATFAWKQVALSDVFPNKENTKVGYNWNTDANVNPKSEKAEETLKEIEEASNKVYEKPQYSYVLTPTVMAEIRKYNDDANKENKNNIPTGGYSNNTLTCKDGKECTSSFLDLDFMKKAAKARNESWTSYKDGSAWK